ncbi:MAG: hypothetical protein ACJ8FY_07890 [Gemmataceae bacterium]
MGLALEVGYLADLLQNDEEGAQCFQDEIEKLNKFLTSMGQPIHHEPKQCPVFSCAMGSYSNLHYLRRFAARVDLEGVLPSPGGPDASKDLVMEKYYQLACKSEPSFLGRLLGRSTRTLTLTI